jgi:anaerobic selenocysteine-containing dehydrogenase
VNKQSQKISFKFISRRAFLKISGAVTLALAASRLIKHTAFAATPQPQDTGEGVITEKWVATSCLNCSSRCATRVRVVNGKAVFVANNPLDKVSEGKNCARALVGLQVLYDPARLKGPVKRTNPEKGKGIDPGWERISWEQALSEVGERLKALRGNFASPGQPQQLLLLNGLNVTSDEDVIRRFADAYGTPNLISEQSLEDEAEKAGRWLADGNYTACAYDLPATNYILAFGASIIESEPPLARNLRMWGKIRRERPNRAKVVTIDPRYSVTAAKSDQWLPITPGTDASLAMAIANVIISENLYDASFVSNWTEGFDEYKDLVLRDYSPEDAAVITGIPADTIRQIAREFATSQPAIAWMGRGATRWPNGSYTAYAVYCLNALVGSIDAPGGVLYQQDPEYREMIPVDFYDDIAREGKAKPRIDLSKTSQFPAADAVINQVAASITESKPYRIDMAIGFNTNLNMSAPGADRWDEALKKLPYYVHIAPFASEMADYADIILPAPTFLEQWGYDHSPPGSGFAEVKIKQPVVEASHDTKDITEIIISLAMSLGGTVADNLAALGGNAEQFVKYRTQDLIPWEQFTEDGVWVGPAYKYNKYDSVFQTPSKKFEFKSGNLARRFQELGVSSAAPDLLPHYTASQSLGNAGEFPLILSVYQPLLDIKNGSQNYPWAQELYLVLQGRGWTNLAEINGETAASLKIWDDDMVWVESPFGRIKLKARVTDGIRPGVVSIASGQGHYADGRWQKNIGINPNDIIGVDYDKLSGQSSFLNTRVKVYRA